MRPALLSSRRTARGVGARGGLHTCGVPEIRGARDGRNTGRAGAVGYSTPTHRGADPCKEKKKKESGTGRVPWGCRCRPVQPRTAAGSSLYIYRLYSPNANHPKRKPPKTTHTTQREPTPPPETVGTGTAHPGGFFSGVIPRQDIAGGVCPEKN